MPWCANLSFRANEALEVVADHHPDLATYLPVLEMTMRTGFGNAGRLEAMTWQLVFQHMLELRRRAVARERQHFYTVEQAVLKAVKRLKLDDPYLEWVVVFAKTLDACGDPGPWAGLEARMKSWSSS